MLAVPASASVDTLREARTTEVRYNDLNLSHAAGQEELNSRIERAVRKVCRSHTSRNLRERLDVAECEENARTAAQAQAEKRIAEYTGTRKPFARAQRVATDN
jgi:UrcA family protein